MWTCASRESLGHSFWRAFASPVAPLDLRALSRPTPGGRTPEPSERSVLHSAYESALASARSER